MAEVLCSRPGRVPAPSSSSLPELGVTQAGDTATASDPVSQSRRGHNQRRGGEQALRAALLLGSQANYFDWG